MEEIKTNIGPITFLLAGIAGFCDTVTFVAGDSIFSAHITGNFVLFAAQLLTGHSEGSWIKLLTFPVFIIAVITGGWLTDQMKNRRRILLIQSLLLILGGLIAMLLPAHFLESGGTLYFIVMITVFAMGLQNTFGKLFAKEIFGPTTIMTGNVTQASLYVGIILRKGIKNDPVTWQNLKEISVTFGGFLTGCFAGAWMGNVGGLATIAIPGIVIMMYYFSEYTMQVQSRYFKRK